MHSQGTGPPKLLLWLVVAALLAAVCSALNQDPWQVIVHQYPAQLKHGQSSNNCNYNSAAGPHACTARLASN
jgi:hypothetical protein